MDKIELKKNDDINQIIESDTFKYAQENNSCSSKSINKVKSFKEELLFFKNDILKDMKDSITKINSKLNQKFSELEEKLDKIQIKNDINCQTINSIKQEANNDKINQQRFSVLEKFKIKVDETMSSYEYKFRHLEAELRETKNKYETIIIDNILYPGIIGKNNEFKTFHDLVDFLLLNTKKLLFSKEKEEVEKTKSKNKIEEILNNYKSHINFCVNKVEDLNFKLNKFNELHILKDVEELKKKEIENHDKTESISKKIEEDEKNMEKLNIQINNKLKERIQVLNKEIIDINNNIKEIQDKHNEFINDFELIKKDVNKNQVILTEILKKGFESLFKDDNQFLNIYSKYFENNKDIENGKINFNKESIIKHYINGDITINDLNKSHSFINNRDNNNKSFLSDVELDLTKNKQKFLKLNLKRKQNMNFDYLPNEEFNNRTNYYEKNERKNKIQRKSGKIDNSNYLLLGKIPKIKQYNNLNILKDDPTKQKPKTIDSNSLFNEMDGNINSDNKIHSKEYINRNSSISNIKSEIVKHYNNLFLKRSKEEENNKINESKDFKENNKTNNKKHVNYVHIKINDINQQRLLSAKERINHSYINNKKENSQKIQNFNNSYIQFNKKQRLLSSKIREDIMVNKMDINFDDSRIIQNNEKKKFDKNINQIKNILPYKDRNFFKERVQKFANFDIKKNNKK